MSTRGETIIIGAGPAGLAMGACLRKAGVDFTMLERADSVGHAWRHHYERLHLHTVRQHSSLPYLPFPADYPKYVPRDLVYEYLSTYAKNFQIEPNLNEEVQRVEKRGGLWHVSTDKAEYDAENVIVCTGYNRIPYRPTWPGEDRFTGEIIHSHDYLNGKPYAGKRVLVVGIGNTGGEIALDLHEHGATPYICVRGPINVVPRDVLGSPAQVTGIMLTRLPDGVADFVSKTLQKLVVGDLSAYGITLAKSSPYADVEKRGRVPLIDIGTIALIKEGKLPVVPGIERFTETGVVFEDGREEAFNAVVLATGYRTGLTDFIEGAEELTDERGYPKTLDGPARPGLYFLGFKNPVSGFLRQIAIDSKAVARDIAAKSGVASRE